MVTTRKRRQASDQGDEHAADDATAQEPAQQQDHQEQAHQQQQQQPEVNKKRQRAPTDKPLGGKAAAKLQPAADEAGEHAEHSNQPQEGSKQAAGAANPMADLLPMELLMQLAQKHQNQRQSHNSVQQQKQHPPQQQQAVQKKHKRFIAALQKGPVKVAVLPAVVAEPATVAGAQPGAALRQQLLGRGTLKRSPAMLQPAGVRFRSQ